MAPPCEYDGTIPARGDAALRQIIIMIILFIILILLLILFIPGSIVPLGFKTRS